MIQKNRVTFLPVDIVMDEMSKTESKVRRVYLLNKANIVIEYDDNTYREMPANLEVLNPRKRDELKEILYKLFDNNIDYREKLKLNLKNNNFSEVYNSEIIEFVYEINECIEALSIQLSAKIYSKIKKYVSPEVIEDYIKSIGISKIKSFIDKYLEDLRNGDEKAIKMLYKKFIEYEKSKYLL